MEKKIEDLTKQLDDNEFLFSEDDSEFSFRNNSLTSIFTIEKLSPCILILDLSYNTLVDISPLSHIINLEKLNLEYNHISDISPLATLTSLYYLNLKCNKLAEVIPYPRNDHKSSTKSSLYPLLSIISAKLSNENELMDNPHSLELFLEGNLPLCNVDKWIVDAFTYLCIDGISLLQKNEVSSMLDLNLRLIVDGINESEVVPFVKRRRHLRQKIAQFAENKINLQSLNTSTISDSNSGSESDSDEEDWMEELEHLTQKLEESQELVGTLQMEVEMHSHLKKNAEQTLISEMQEHAEFLTEYRLKHMEKEHEIDELTSHLIKEQDEKKQFKAALVNIVSNVQQKIEQSTNCVIYQVQFAHLLHILDRMVLRITNAESRVSVATVLVNEKMHQIRNETALLEIKKRHFYMEQKQCQHEKRNQIGYEGRGFVDDSRCNRTSLSNLKISPIVEALFKSIYKKLCQDNQLQEPVGTVGSGTHNDAKAKINVEYGLVDICDLYMVLVCTPSIESLLITHMGYDGYESCLQQLKALGASHGIQLEKLNSSSSDCEDFEVDHFVGLTYGEMLLLLVPTAHDISQHGGSTYDYRHTYAELAKKQYYLDDEFSMIPLQIDWTGGKDPEYRNECNSESNSMRNGSMDRGTCANCDQLLRNETKRLKRERTFLLQRIQSQCRQLDRRVECVQDYFDGLLHEKDVQINYLSTTNTTDRHTIKELQQKTCEQDESIVSLQQALQDTKKAHAEAKNMYEAKISQLHEDMVNKSYYNDLSRMNIKLEEELNCLRTETVKLKRENTAYSRDVTRLESELLNFKQEKDALHLNSQQQYQLQLNKQQETFDKLLKEKNSEFENKSLELENALIKIKLLEDQLLSKKKESESERKQKRDQGTECNLDSRIIESDRDLASPSMSNHCIKSELNEKGKDLSTGLRNSNLNTGTTSNPSASVPLSSSYLMNRIQQLQMKIDKGLI